MPPLRVRSENALSLDVGGTRFELGDDHELVRPVQRSLFPPMTSRTLKITSLLRPPFPLVCFRMITDISPLALGSLSLADSLLLAHGGLLPHPTCYLSLVHLATCSLSVPASPSAVKSQGHCFSGKYLGMNESYLLAWNA